MHSLARSFDVEYHAKERDILQAKALLTNIHAEVTEASRHIQSLSEQAAPAEGSRRELEGLQLALRSRLNEAMRSGYEGWVQGQLGREERWRNGATGEDCSDLGGLLAESGGAQEEETLRWEIDEKRRTREDLVRRLVKAQTEVSLRCILPEGDFVEGYIRPGRARGPRSIDG